MQKGIRCVATSPLVEKPHTAKVVNSSQKSTDFAPLARPAMAMTNGLPDRGGNATIWSEPNGAIPTEAGLSGSISSTTGIRHRITPATTSGTMCQVCDTTRLASSGRKTNWPEALPAVSNPTTSPRRCTNQRLAMAVARPTIPAPDPSPTSTPQVRYNCQISVMNALDPAPMTNRAIDSRTVRFRPMVWIRPAAKGPTSPNNRMFSETAPEITAAFQPNASCSGTISTPGVARTPTDARMTTNITTRTTQE